jgi:uncharacterized membrane protein
MEHEDREKQKTLYVHTQHPYRAVNVNEMHAEERQSFNDALALWLTTTVGTMPTAYLFVLLALVGLLGILGILPPVVALLVAWTSQTLIQLTLLPVIMVSQNVLSRHQELQADEQYHTTMRSYHDIEQIIHHLDAQDARILEMDARLLTILEKLEQPTPRKRAKPARQTEG